MKNPLDSLWWTILLGVVLTGVLYYLAQMLVAQSAAT